MFVSDHFNSLPGPKLYHTLQYNKFQSNLNTEASFLVLQMLEPLGDIFGFLFGLFWF